MGWGKQDFPLKRNWGPTEETYSEDLNYNSGDKFHTGWNESSEVTDLKAKPQGGIMPVATQEFRQDQAGSRASL